MERIEMNKYLEFYKLKKETFLTNNRYDIGKNAAWGIGLPYGELGYKYNNWYIPGLLEIYRKDELFFFKEETTLYDKFKKLKIDFAEQDLDCFIRMIKHGLKIDLSKSPKATFSFDKNNKLSEIIVLIYKSKSSIANSVGFKYRYFFIREEKLLNFYSTVVDNWCFLEGSKEKLIDLFSQEKTILSQFSFYLSWEWENI